MRQVDRKKNFLAALVAKQIEGWPIKSNLLANELEFFSASTLRYQKTCKSESCPNKNQIKDELVSGWILADEPELEPFELRH